MTKEHVEAALLEMGNAVLDTKRKMPEEQIPDFIAKLVASVDVAWGMWFCSDECRGHFQIVKGGQLVFVGQEFTTTVIPCATRDDADALENLFGEKKPLQ